MRWIVGISCLLLLSTRLVLAACDEGGAEAESQSPAEYRGLPFLSIPLLAAPEKLTGDLSHAVWAKAAVVALNDSRGTPATLATEARVFCTRDALYVGFRCAEAKPNELLLSDAEIWKRDDVEIFLEPYEETLKRPYHHLMIDASGATGSGRYHVYPRYFRLKSGEQKWAPKLEIATGKSASAWTLEVKIPFDQIVFNDTAAEKKSLWRLNLCRSRPARNGEPAMAWSWSPLNSGAFQTPWRFGYALPAVFASEALRQRVLSAPHVSAADPSSSRAADATVLATVEAALTDLIVAEKFDAASAQLKKLAYEGPALYATVEAAAKAKVKAGENSGRRALQEFLYVLDRDRPDDDPPAQDVLDTIAQFEPRKYTDEKGKALNYRLLKPANFDPNGNQKYPLMLFMHGSGECGGDNWRQLFGGCLTYLRPDIRAKYPAFVLAPQCPLGSQWADTRSNPLSLDVMKATSNYRAAEQPGDTMRLLLELIPQLEREYPAIDTSRLYVAGISLGGYGTWECLTRKPEWFAAAAPVCGGGDETQASLFAKVPLWIFHGAKDPGVKVQSSRNMVQALKNAGGSPKYSEYPEGLHNIGEHNADPETLEWMFAQRLQR